MRDSLSDSSEELYSLNAHSANIFDFTTLETYVSSDPISLITVDTKLKSRLTRIVSLLKALAFNSFRLTLEFTVFLAFSLVYLKAKLINLISFLDLSKDKIVSTLMWRRGLLFRPATHGGVVVIVALAVVAGGLFSRGQVAAQDLTASDAILKSTNTTKTIVPTDRPRSDVVTYKVASGDTLSTLANKYNVSIETLKWANNLGDSDVLSPNQTLSIPPVTGIVYKVKANDTLDTIAKAYAADKQTIVDFPFNYIDDSLSLKVGQTLFVPNGSIPAPAPVRTLVTRPTFNFVVGSGMLSWPVPAHISQYYSWYHPAIDIANPYGTPIYAAAAGTVVDTKKMTVNFGWYCIVDSGNGYTEAYAHMGELACTLGERVEKGQYLGSVGLTGRTTGPHLHFEVRLNNKTVDPLTLLK